MWLLGSPSTCATGEMGFPVGVLSPLPRTLHMYEEQASWRLEDDPYMREEVWRSNYSSVEPHVQFFREHFEQECAEGLMEKFTLEEAKKKFGDKVAISSLAVLVEENQSGKRRSFTTQLMGRRSTIALDAEIKFAVLQLEKNNTFLHTTRGRRQFCSAWLVTSARLIDDSCMPWRNGVFWLVGSWMGMTTSM